MNAELKGYLRLEKKMRNEWAEDRLEAGRVAMVRFVQYACAGMMGGR